jgi:phosphatidylethanolamine-binding protein (PEBP) family uncharacterized protein
MDAFSLESSAFENAQAIPDRHSCEGEDVSPPLRWTNVPGETRSLALVVDDPDAPGGVVPAVLACAEQFVEAVPQLARLSQCQVDAV